ncbi:hypothetical protein JJJ17_09575 [Paracoccus caeni]|uniref:Lipoprotein n=1 Tax=Paracoccus caeni TaxID=657651 RepID=A0A934SEG1_9RHOB|nr:hypothetical protein [Paracoccus caeni]MBK4216173.1 hypothetical protein [Paracoccus caeni]
MNKSISAALIISSLLLSGCKSALSETTDAQLLQLVGMTRSEGQPAQITPRMIECVELLSNARAEVYKDMPEEISGVIKTECRKDLQARLDDTSLNPTGLSLSDFESEEMLQRVEALRDTQANALETYREEREAARREAEEQERKARQDLVTAQIAEAKQAIPVLKAGLQERIDRLAPACALLLKTRGELEMQNWEHRLLLDQPHWFCFQDPVLGSESYEIANFADHLAQVEEMIAQDQVQRASIWEIPSFDFDTIDEQIDVIIADEKKIRAALSAE